MERRVPYFTDYVKRFTDLPFLVTLDEREPGLETDTYTPGAFVTARDLDLAPTAEAAARRWMPVFHDARCRRCGSERLATTVFDLMPAQYVVLRDGLGTPAAPPTARPARRHRPRAVGLGDRPDPTAAGRGSLAPCAPRCTDRLRARLWCIVFPLGMYATATTPLATAGGFSALTAAERPYARAAALVWLLAGIRCVIARPRRSGEAASAVR